MMVRKRSMAGIRPVDDLVHQREQSLSQGLAEYPPAGGRDDHGERLSGARRLLRTLRGRNQARRRYDTLWRQCAG